MKKAQTNIHRAYFLDRSWIIQKIFPSLNLFSTLHTPCNEDKIFRDILLLYIKDHIQWNKCTLKGKLKLWIKVIRFIMFKVSPTKQNCCQTQNAYLFSLIEILWNILKTDSSYFLRA